MLRWWSLVALLATLACSSSDPVPETKADEPPPTKQAPEPKGPQLSPEALALTKNAAGIVQKIAELETEKDVVCWTSFRQLDNFIASKTYSDFAMLTKVAAIKALTRAVWAKASSSAKAPTVTAEDIDGAASLPEAALPEDRKQAVTDFATNLGLKQFADYRTTSEHWRVLLSIAQDEIRAQSPALKPLGEGGDERLALAVTQLSLALLQESGEIATVARTPMIEAPHVKQALVTLRDRFGLEASPAAAGPMSPAALGPLRTLTRGLIDAKVQALRSYNQASEDLVAELNKISKLELRPDAVELLMAELLSFARFVSKGFTPMRADNYLADGNFAPSKLSGKDYVGAASVENVAMQVFPHVMMPNGDVKLRFVPRPGNVSKRELEPQDVVLLDHQMNGVRDTAIHWVVLQTVWQNEPYAMDPFAAEYLSEVVSIIATYNIRRAQTIARQLDKEVIDAEVMKRVRDVGYVMVPPEEQAVAKWGPAEIKRKAKALRGIGKGGLFRNATAKAGLSAKLSELPPIEGAFDIQRVMGSGIAVGDVDEDGFVDLFLAGEGLGRLYLNGGQAYPGKFRDATEAFGVPKGLDDSRGALFVDLDGEGGLELVILRSKHPSLVLAKQGEKLVDVTKKWGLATRNGAHVASAFDYDQDGDLDLYVGYYGSAACNRGECPGRNLPSIDGRNGTPNQLWRNDGGSLTEVGAEAGVDDAGWTLAVSTFDYDVDGKLDFYLANDFGANVLYRNEGGGKFKNVARETGAGDRGSGMNVSVTDLNADGRWDLYVTNIDMFSKNIKIVFPTDESIVELDDTILRSFQYLSGNKLYVSARDDKHRARFVDEDHLRFEPGDRGWGWAGVFFDVDNDGDEDMYLANGWIEGSPAADQRNQMFVLDGGTYFLAPQGPEAFPGNSRAVVALDADRDGDLDLVVNNFRQAPRLLENLYDGPNKWIRLRLRGAAPNTRGVGARLTVKGGSQLRQVTAGTGYLGQDDEVIHVGVGEVSKVGVRVDWPNGKVQHFNNLETNREHELSQQAS